MKMLFKTDFYPIWKEPGPNWENTDNRRRFFDELAKEMGFDASVEENWYKVSRSHVLARKVYIFVLCMCVCVCAGVLCVGVLCGCIVCGVCCVG